MTPSACSTGIFPRPFTFIFSFNSIAARNRLSAASRVQVPSAFPVISIVNLNPL
jgi:hypothetical protein